jgi:hypothetical protein
VRPGSRRKSRSATIAHLRRFAHFEILGRNSILASRFNKQQHGR